MQATSPVSTNAYTRLLIMAAAGLAPFILARLGLLALYPDDFGALTFGDIAYAFIYGLRFDASVLAQFIGLPLLLMLLPFRWAHSPWWQGLWSWFVFAMLAVLVFALAADLVYFGVVHRHIGPEAAIISGDPALVLDMAVSDYGWTLVLFTAGVVAGAMLWRRITQARPAPAPRKSIRLAVIILLFGLFVIVGRGGLQYKPISIVNAFGPAPVSAGYLTLNGPFSIAHSIMSSQPKQVELLPPEEAVAEAQALLFTPREQNVDQQYPLLRHAAGKPGRKPNVVVLMLESWDAIHVDALRRQKGLEPLGATPNFDALAQNGRLYTRFYAAGQRSMDGLAALLASVPTVPGMPYIGKGLEQSDLSFLGHLARSQGYETIFLQSSNRGSFHVDAIAARAGFGTYLGAEDIPSAHDDITETSGWGVWDHDTLQTANRLFAEAAKPFVGFIFTSSTHQPWRIPNARWRKYEGDDKLDRYLNSLSYADWAIGQFIEAAKKAGYYDNTIFILTADHVSHLGVTPQDITTMYHVPLLMVGPGLEPGTDERIGSQLDVLPTIVELAGWDVTHASLGRSLLDDSDRQTRGAFCINWKNVERIEQTGWVSHNLSRRVAADVRGSEADADAIERRLLALYETTVELLLENRLYRSDTPKPPRSAVAAAP